MDKLTYILVDCDVIPCYRFIEGCSKEEYWADYQNCLYYSYEDDSEVKDKKFWIILPHKPKGIRINNDNEELIKWMTEDKKEWDFENHKPID